MERRQGASPLQCSSAVDPIHRRRKPPEFPLLTPKLRPPPSVVLTSCRRRVLSSTCSSSLRLLVFRFPFQIPAIRFGLPSALSQSSLGPALFARRRVHPRPVLSPLRPRRQRSVAFPSGSYLSAFFFLPLLGVSATITAHVPPRKAVYLEQYL